MMTLAEKIAAIPADVLSAPGRALLDEIVQLNRDWAVDVVDLNGQWFLVEKNRFDGEKLTPIEVFDLEENTLLS
jgi:hypothetical protein